MSETNVEKRLSALERTVAELLQSHRNPAKGKDWKRTIGMFSGNELMKEIDAAGRKIRDDDRARARPRRTQVRRKRK
jgi:hypothetical protein